MKTLVTFLCIGCGFLLNAQDWCHLGSKWTYDYSDDEATGYTTFSYEKDTMVFGQQCKMLTGTAVVDQFPLFTSSTDTYAVAPIYTFSRNDTVFFYRDWDSSFIATYFFNVSLNDTIAYNNNSPGGLSLCNTSKQVVDSVGIETIGGLALRFYVVRVIDTLAYFTSNKVVERLGAFGNYGALPFPCATTDAYWDGLRCYQDDSFNLYQLYSDLPCDFVTSIETPTAQIHTIYPNPATDYAIVDYGFTDWNKGQPNLEICNTLGQVVYEQVLPMFSGFQKVDVSGFASGMYAVYIKRSGGVVATNKLVRQ